MMRRRDAMVSLAALGVVGATFGGLAKARRAVAAKTQAQVPSRHTPPVDYPFWGINTNIKYRSRDPAYRKTILALARDLNMGYVREAVYGMGGTEVDEPFDWQWLDSTLDDLEAAGMGCMLALRIEDCRNPDRFGPAWERNVRYRVRTVAQRYGQRILWYSSWNEPDLDPVEVPTILNAQRLTYETLKDVQPELLLQSAPLSTPRGAEDKMYGLCDGGITRHCDFLGCNLHHGIDDGSRNGLKHAWLAQQRANTQHGHPIRPVTLSENGYRWTVVRHPDQHALRAHWARLNQVQVKRYGYARGIVYSLALSRGREGFNLVDPEAGFSKFQPEYDAYRDAYNAAAWTLDRGFNAGFEEPQSDATSGWVVHYDPLSLSGDPEPFSEWDRVAFRTDGALARSGQGYCRMMAGGGNRVLRLVEGLTPEQSYRLAAWVRLSGAGASAQLAATGHNRLNGLDDRIDQTAETDRWVELATMFIPSHPWVVIALDHNGRGEAVWDDVTLHSA